MNAKPQQGPRSDRIAPLFATIAAAAASLAAITSVSLREPFAGDGADAVLLLAVLSQATAMINAGYLSPNARWLAAMPLAASCFGLIHGPAILWKLQLPLMLIPLATTWAVSERQAIPE